LNTGIAIIGAGPTGIGAALRLLELGRQDFVLIDAADIRTRSLGMSTASRARFLGRRTNLRRTSFTERWATMT
jgi:glycine/D-amino acid oxidase-like deaminating enzyme